MIYLMLLDDKKRPADSAGYLHSWHKMMLLGISLALILSACSVPRPLSPYPGLKDVEPAIRLCKENKDCLDGQFCYKHYCKALSLPKGQIVSLHLVPSSSHRLIGPNSFVTKQQFIGIDIGRLTEKRPIYIREAYLVKGSISIKSSKDNSPVPSKVRFIDKDAIKGNPIAIQVETDASGTFQVRLTHGTYQLEITPKDGKHPTHRVPVVNIEKSGNYSFFVPDDEKYPHLTGRIVTPETKEPISGLKIIAFSAIGTIISTVVETDQNGVFEMWLSAKEKPHHLRIQMRTPDEKSNEPPHPQVEIPFAPNHIRPGERIELGDIPAGHKAAPITVSGSIQGLRLHGQEIPYTNVYLTGKIQLKSTYKGQELQGYYRAETTGDSSGQYKALVLPGSYTIEVLPPVTTSGSWSRASIQVGQVSKSLKSMDISLQPRLTISGTVCQTGKVGECEHPLPKAQVKAIWRNVLAPSKDPNASPSIPSMQTPVQNSGDPSGSYKLALDPGVYDLLFIPPSDSRFARRIYFGVRIEADASQSEITHHAYLLPAKHLVSTILDPDGFPISNTIVEMYSYSHDAKEAIHLLGRATSNELGEFSLAYRLPSQK